VSARILPGLRHLGLLCLVVLVRPPGRAGELPAAPWPAYEVRATHSPDGIGKFLLGREIAQVMGHPGADWLERPEREEEEEPARVLPALKLRPGDAVADIGAGTGYFTWRLARDVGPTGRVFAVDIQPEMLARLKTVMAARGLSNVVSVLGTDRDPGLAAASVDLALLVDVYHEFEYPREMLAAICRALKPGGRVAFVEYRAEDPSVPIKPLHKMSEAQVRREAAEHPLVWVETISSLPRQHLILFRKPDTAPAPPPKPATP
jgi:SAM-dependent methyltransferase